MPRKPLTYAQSGVGYDELDAFKRLAQRGAQTTRKNASHIIEVGASRGESAYVWEEGSRYRAMVIEGLGTKNLVADAMRAMKKKTYYDAIAQDTVAMIVNDLIVVGAKPDVITAYFAVGDGAWFTDEVRTADLVRGWTHACVESGAIWGGGETPALAGVVGKDIIDLAGSAVGTIYPKKRLVLGDRLKAGDSILLIESSGIHANGLTLARALAKKLPKGYATKLSDGTLYGEALLRPTHIYAKLVQALFAANLDLHYMVNITGHGWRKLMRANKTYTYDMDMVPPMSPLFSFIAEQSGNSEREMYGTFNMGAGFAVMLPAAQAKRAQAIATKQRLKSWIAGTVKKGKKQVIIRPYNIVYGGETLQVRQS